MDVGDGCGNVMVEWIWCVVCGGGESGLEGEVD